MQHGPIETSACSLLARAGTAEPTDEAQLKQKEVVLADKIDELGFGWYQIQVLIICSGFIIAEGAEVQMAAGLVSAMQEEFGIVTHIGKAMLMTWTFIGFTLGTMASGPLADLHGRRTPMLVGYCGVILTAGFTTMASSLTMLYGFRLFLGFFAGIGIPTAFITVAEVTPTVYRGMATAFLGLAYVLGEIWASLGLLMLMPDLVQGSWQLLINWAMIPAIVIVFFGLKSPVTRHDTPFFLACQGKTSEVRQVLNMIAELNGKQHLRLADEATVICHVPEVVAFSEVLPSLLRPPLVSKVFILSYIMFAKDFALFGAGVFWPQMWAVVEGIGAVSPALELLATATMGIPGVLLAVALLKILPRKVGVLLGASITCACALLFRGMPNGRVTAFVGILAFKLFFPTWQMTSMLLPSELLDTRIRGCGFSFAASFGRLATIVSPFAVELGIDGFTGILAALSFGAAVLVALLPETKDCELTEDAVNEAPKTSQRQLLGDGITPSYGTAATKV